MPWVEHFEQRAGRIAAKIRAELVDLIEHEHGVARTAAAQFLNDAARHRSDVRAAMTANFRFVAHAAQTYPHKLAAERVGNRLTQTGFADAGRPEKTHDRAVPLRIEFPHGQIFDQALFNFFQIVVIAIQDLLRLLEIEVVLAQVIPRKICDDLDVTDDDGELRAGRRNKIEPLQFALGLLHHCLGRLGFFEPFAQLLRLFFAAALGLAQFALDRLELRPQISAPLRIGKLRVHIFLQSLLNLGDLQLRRDLLLHNANALFHIKLLENRLFLGNIDVQVRPQKIRELLRVIDIEDHQTRLLRRVRSQLKQSRSRITQVPECCLPFLGFRRLNGLGQIDFGAEKRRSCNNFAKRKPAQSLRDDKHMVVRLSYELEHKRDCAY